MSHHNKERRKGLQRNIKLLWNYWALSLGSLSALALLSPIVDAKYMPLIAFSIVVMLMYLDRRNRSKKSPDCFRQPFIIIVTLTLTALAMSVALLIDPDVFRSPYHGADTPNPFLTILILGPASIVVSIYYMIRGNNPSYCKACKARNGDSVDRGFMGSILNHETKEQGKLFFLISMFIAVVTWTYYFCFYIDINVNKSDRFYFVAFPVAIYIFSLIYLGIRYYSIWGDFISDPELMKLLGRKGTTLRFILINGENIYLAAPSLTEIESISASDDLRIDTPIVFHLEHREHVSIDEVRAMLKDSLPIDDIDVRYLYESHDHSMINNVVHYCAYIPDEDSVPQSLSGEWFTFGEVVKMVKSGMIANALTTELRRIYTIAITVKTYDIDGNKRYPIKHYRPTFSLADIKKIDVDYNDDRWLAVAYTNADKRFFKLRRLWKRVVKGGGI